MGRLNGSLLHRLERVELLLPAPEPEPVDPVEQFWWPVFQIAPQPLWDYFIALDGPEGHPAVDDALKALWQRIEHPHRLSHCQGEILKWASWRYGHHLARERQRLGVTTAVVCDAIVAELKSHHVLGWSAKDSDDNWVHPERFAEQWRNGSRVSKTDPDVLTAAGLFREELDLLESEDD